LGERLKDLAPLGSKKKADQREECARCGSGRSAEALLRNMVPVEKRNAFPKLRRNGWAFIAHKTENGWGAAASEVKAM